MSTRNLAWAVTGGISLLLAVACGGENIRDVGDVDEAGKGGLGAGGSTGGFDTAGTDSGGFDTAGTGSGGFGTAGSGWGGFGFAGGGSVGGAPSDCFAAPNGYMEVAPTTAPQNAVFIDAHSVAAEMVRNTADQQVFTNMGWVSEAYANLSASAAATDTAIGLPAQLSQVAANLGQFYVARADCVGKPAAGRRLTVEFWWKIGGAIGEFPTHGVALGTVSNKGKAVWFEDSAKSYVIGEPSTKRLTNTLNKLVVQHSFAEDDETDAGKVTLGVWLLPDAELASTFYIGKVTWD